MSITTTATITYSDADLTDDEKWSSVLETKVQELGVISNRMRDARRALFDARYELSYITHNSNWAGHRETESYLALLGKYTEHETKAQQALDAAMADEASVDDEIASLRARRYAAIRATIDLEDARAHEAARLYHGPR